MEITQFIEDLKRRGMVPSMKRFRYNVNLTTAGSYMQQIGKALTKDFVIDNDNKFVFLNILKWLVGDETAECLNPESRQVITADLKKGLYIAGPTGTGKTMCLKVFQLFAKIDDVKVEFMNADQGKPDKYFIFGGEQFRSDQICDEFAKTGKLEKFKKARILTINDMGSESSETLYMGNRLNCLQEIVEYRGDQLDQLTFITSNNRINDQDNVAKYGDRVVSRLTEMCNYYELTGKDRRK